MTSGSFFSFIRLAYHRVHPANCQQDPTTRKISDLDSIPTAVLLRFASFRPLRPFSFVPGQVFFFLFGRFFFFFFFYTGCIWCIVTTLRNNALHNVYTTSHAQQQRKKLLPSPTRALLFLLFIIFPASLLHFLTGVEHVLGELLEPESIFIKRQPSSFYFRHIRK